MRNRRANWNKPAMRAACGTHDSTSCPLHPESLRGGGVPQAEDRAHHEGGEVGVSP